MGRLAVLVLVLGVVAVADALRGVQDSSVQSLQEQVSAEKNKINELEAQNQKDRSTFLNFIKKASNIMGQDNKIFKGVDTKTGEIKADMAEDAKPEAAAAAAEAPAATPEAEDKPEISAKVGVEPPQEEAVDDEEVKDKTPKPEYATEQTYPGHGLMDASNAHEQQQVFRYAAPPPGGAPPRQTEAELKDPTTVKKKEEEDHSKYNLFEALPSPDEPIEPIVVESSRDIPKATTGYSLNPPPPGPQNYAEPAPAPQVDIIHQQVGDNLQGPPMGDIPVDAANNAPVEENADEQADVAAVAAGSA